MTETKLDFEKDLEVFNYRESSKYFESLLDCVYHGSNNDHYDKTEII